MFLDGAGKKTRFNDGALNYQQLDREKFLINLARGSVVHAYR